MITVKACEACNNTKGDYDDYLRDMLTMDHHGQEHDVARQIFDSKVLSSSRTNRSQLARQVNRDAKPIEIITRSGIFVETGYVTRIAEDQMNHVFSFIIRGLNYHMRQSVLDSDVEFKVRRVHDLQEAQVIHQKTFADVSPLTIGRDIFWCKSLVSEAEASLTTWLFVFYDRVAFHACSNPKGWTNPRDNSSAGERISPEATE